MKAKKGWFFYCLAYLVILTSCQERTSIEAIDYHKKIKPLTEELRLKYNAVHQAFLASDTVIFEEAKNEGIKYCDYVYSELVKINDYKGSDDYLIAAKHLVSTVKGLITSEMPQMMQMQVYVDDGIRLADNNLEELETKVSYTNKIDIMSQTVNTKIIEAVKKLQEAQEIFAVQNNFKLDSEK